MYRIRAVGEHGLLTVRLNLAVLSPTGLQTTLFRIITPVLQHDPNQHLLNHVEWWRCYYHWMRPHQMLREPVPGEKHRHRDRTPAMVLGLTDHLWTVEEILRTPVLTPLARSDPAHLATRAALVA